MLNLSFTEFDHGGRTAEMTLDRHSERIAEAHTFRTSYRRQMQGPPVQVPPAWTCCVVASR